MQTAPFTGQRPYVWPPASELADDEAPDPVGPLASTGVAAPAAAGAIARRAWDGCRTALEPHRVAYTCNLLELFVWAIAAAWVVARIRDGQTRRALRTLARTKLPPD